MQKPLADLLRPQTLDDVVGQRHILGPGGVLRRLIEAGQIPNLIFYGPSGTGKTTVANIIAKETNRRFFKLNATNASVADIKEVVSQLNTLMTQNGILLYLDEIQNFNKRQQQSLLEYIENGSITLVASTTENPYFYVYNAILSRCSVFEFRQVETAEVLRALRRAAEKLGQLYPGRKITFTDEALEHFAFLSGGDVRKAINCMEVAALSHIGGAAGSSSEVKRANGISGEDGSDRKSSAADSAPNAADTEKAAGEGDFHSESAEKGDTVIDLKEAENATQSKSFRYDRSGDSHYDILSAFQKSIRGSDVNAALHYLARLIVGGDLISICRRLMVIASEDVGLAYPMACVITRALVESANQLGFPEARIPLAQAVITLATAPKTNSAIVSIDRAIADVEQKNCGDVPDHLKDTHYGGAQKLGRGGYKYAHDYPHHYVRQQYLPDAIQDAVYFEYGESANEQKLKRYWEELLNRPDIQ